MSSSDGEITLGPVLKKPEIKRDPEGRFERHGKALSKTAKKRKPNADMATKFAEIAEHERINNSDLIEPITPR